jgi:sigma-B regulation protein RsbU (phosphoserine phosphatase)
MATEAAGFVAGSAPASALDVLVLHTLERCGPLNGYRIATMVEQVVGPRDGALDLPTLYSAILQQKQRGLLSATVSTCDGRQVRTYAITPRGRRFLKNATVAWERSASLLSGLLEEQGRQRRELELAREVQTHFFSSLPRSGDLKIDIAGRYRPARELGGDYYDIVRLSETAIALTLGDVCGKGVAAALLMATLRAYVRSQPSTPDQLPALMSRLNHLLRESCPAGRFASLFYAVYDVTQPHLMYVNAGHHAPVLVNASAEAAPALLESSGPVLGLLSDATYEVGEVAFPAGSVMVAYTDGLTEACDASGSEWGQARLICRARTGRGLSADVLADQLLDDVTRFVADGPQHDDMTLLVARRLAA